MTAPYSLHRNGVAERRWQAAGKMARCLLKQANLPNSLWVRAVDVAFYLTNRCLSGSLPPNKTPFELFYGRKPDLSNLKVFGCSAFRFFEVGVKKLDSKAVTEIFVVYGRTHDSYFLYNPVTGKISHSRNVSFNEKELLGFGSSFPEDSEFLPEPKSFSDVEEEQVVSSKPLKSVVENDDSRTQETSPVPESSTSNSNPDLYAEFRTRSGRHVKTVERYGCPIDNSENVSFVECFSCEAVPNSLEEFKRSQSRDEWLEAMTKEFKSLVDNKTWELCELPAHKKSLVGRWVFALKKNENGKVVKYKARYVAKGFNQIFDSDYLETFAPTTKLSSICLLSALATHFHCEVFQFDVSSAYLNADLEEDVYVEQPPGFEIPGKGSKFFCKLLKKLYDLKQAGRCWNRTLDKFLTEFGLTRSMIDSCRYSKSDMSGNRLFICVWVDDIIYFSKSSDLAESFKKCFSEKFKIEDKGSMKWFLGVSVDQSPVKINFSQKSYILDLFSCFGMSDCNPCDLPMTANTRIDKSSCPDLESDIFKDLSEIRSLYMSLVGKLNYLSVVPRPDLSFVVSSLSQVLKNPSHVDWLLAKKVSRYLKGTFDLGLVFKHSECLKLDGFCDSDWGGDPNDRRSTSGYCFKISDDSSVICWCSRKQQTVALSSTEAEFMSISLASQECVYILPLVKSLGLDLDGPILLQGENHGSIKLAQNPITHSRSKNIDIRHHFVRDLVEREVIQLQYIPTDRNIADILTKALGRPKFNQFRCDLFCQSVQHH